MQWNLLESILCFRATTTTSVDTVLWRYECPSIAYSMATDQSTQFRKGRCMQMKDQFFHWLQALMVCVSLYTISNALIFSLFFKLHILNCCATVPELLKPVTQFPYNNGCTFYEKLRTECTPLRFTFYFKDN